VVGTTGRPGPPPTFVYRAPNSRCQHSGTGIDTKSDGLPATSLQPNVLHEGATNATAAPQNLRFIAARLHSLLYDAPANRDFKSRRVAGLAAAGAEVGRPPVSHTTASVQPVAALLDPTDLAVGQRDFGVPGRFPFGAGWRIPCSSIDDCS